MTACSKISSPATKTLELARPRLDGLSEAVGIAPLPLHITSRPKTTDTIIEKLRRERGMSLARMRDLAGFRVVGFLTSQLRIGSLTRSPLAFRRIRDRRSELTGEPIRVTDTGRFMPK